jgi:hypothetical protein
MKTLIEVQQVLSDQLDKLQNNEVDPATANAICKKAGELIHSARMQLKCGKHVAELGRFFPLKSGTST